MSRTTDVIIICVIAFLYRECYCNLMKRKVWVNKANSFEEAQQFDSDYYLNLSSAERVETMQILREAYFTATVLAAHENGKILRRVFRVIKQA